MAYIHDGPSLYLTQDGQVVPEGDPNAATLLVATGGTLDPALVQQYGLDQSEPDTADTADEPKQKAASANKAKAAPENK